MPSWTFQPDLIAWQEKTHPEPFISLPQQFSKTRALWNNSATYQTEKRRRKNWNDKFFKQPRLLIIQEVFLKVTHTRPAHFSNRRAATRSHVKRRLAEPPTALWCCWRRIKAKKKMRRKRRRRKRSRPVSLLSPPSPSSPCLFLMWTLRLPDWEKVFPQIPQWWGFSPAGERQTDGEMQHPSCNSPRNW